MRFMGNRTDWTMLSVEEITKEFDKAFAERAERVAARAAAAQSYWSGDEFNQPSVDGIRHTSRKSGAV